MARVALAELAETPGLKHLAWHDFEVQEWVRAHRQQGFDFRGLDDHVLRMECYAELNRQLDAEKMPTFAPPAS